MGDVHSREKRSYNMSRIKSKNTGPELMVRRFLFCHGFRFRIHYKKLPGKPDIVIPRIKTIIDVRGCFWHGHKDCKFGDRVKSNSDIYERRIRPAKLRDESNHKVWKQLEWNVIVIWDMCQLEMKKKRSKKREKTLLNLLNKLNKISDSSN